MGRRPLPTTEIVEKQIEAWCEIDKVKDELQHIWLRLQAAQKALYEADGLVEKEGTHER